MVESDQQFARKIKDLEDRLFSDPPIGEVALEILRNPVWRGEQTREALKTRTAELIKQNPQHQKV